MTELTFLGTGNFLAPGRYWNSFLLDGTVLVEPSPTALPNLRRVGAAAGNLEAVVISHFHPDHTFGWPFLTLELLLALPTQEISIIGPPGVRDFLADMMRLGSVTDVYRTAHEKLQLTYVEVDGSWQEAGRLRFRAVEVEHVPSLRCFGYLFDRGNITVGYSGDTHPCAGLDELASAADTLVLECNGRHPHKSHMDIEAVRDLHARFPDTRLVLTHLGPDIGTADFTHEGVDVPDDFDTLTV
jgi:ribonuclease Z